MADGIAHLVDALGDIHFTFAVNWHRYLVSVVEGILLSPHILPDLDHDSTRKAFEINDFRINDRHFSDLLQFVRCETVSISVSSRKSLILLLRHLGNFSLEQVFVGLRFENSSSLIELNIRSSSDFSGSSHSTDLCSLSIDDFSLVDLATLETILSSEELRIESEDWLLKAILSLGSDHSSLLDFIRIEFLSDEGLQKPVL
jgi:hypothetical protein